MARISFSEHFEACSNACITYDREEIWSRVHKYVGINSQNLPPSAENTRIFGGENPAEKLAIPRPTSRPWPVFIPTSRSPLLIPPRGIKIVCARFLNLQIFISLQKGSKCWVSSKRSITQKLGVIQYPFLAENYRPCT